MIATVYPSKLFGTVDTPPSKSLTHRALFCASFCDNITTILNPLYCDDTLTTMHCLEALGARFLKKNDKIIVTPTDANTLCNLGEITFDVKESATTLRFLMGVCSVLGITANFVGEESLKGRPIFSFINILSKNGISFTANSLPLKMSGTLSTSKLDLSNVESSQYASGVMLASPFIKDNLQLITNGISSNSYILLTKDVMSKFNIDVSIDNNVVSLIKGQGYHSTNDFTVDGDYSSACYLVACGVLCGKVVLSNLNKLSHQGDKAFIDALIQGGANIRFENDSLICEKSSLHGISYNCENCPDIVPILCVTLANASGISQITGVDRLKYKESNRILETLKLLRSFNINCKYENDTITIFGGKMHTESTIDLPNDHRIIMSGVVCSLVNDKSTVLKNVSGVKKSYPNFFDHIKMLGGQIDVSGI